MVEILKSRKPRRTDEAEMDRRSKPIAERNAAAYKV
jgi:hypothetical protein